MTSKILLVNPKIPSLSKEASPLSLALLWIGSYLDQNGYKVKIINVQDQKNYLKIINREIKSSICVGITAMTVQVPNALEISDFIKQSDTSVPIVWGGCHPYLFPESTAKDKSVDIVVIGEGEHTLLELVKYFENKITNLNGIDGIAYFKDRKFIMTQPRDFMDMNEIEKIRWNLLPKITLNKQRGTETYVHTSRGCPHRCTFCINVAVKNRYRVRSAEKVLDDLKDIKEMGFKSFRFRDENFFVNAKRVEEIANGMINRGIDYEWSGTIRADYFKSNHINEELVEKVKKAGCNGFLIGIESGSERIREGVLKKDLTLKEILNSAKICKKFEIKPYYSFMVGIPGETKEDIMKTIDLMDKLIHLCPNAEVVGNVFRPYPGGELYKKCLDMGLKEPDTLRGWSEKTTKDSIYISSYDLPWSEYPDFIDTVSYSTVWTKGKGGLKSKTFKVKVLTTIFFLISRLRWEFKFFEFPLDTKIRNFLNRYKYDL